MLDGIRKYFGSQLEGEATGAAADDGDLRLRIATCALLLEVAHADEDLTTEEIEAIRRLVRQRFSLDDASLDELMELADEERLQSTDLYQFTRLIAENFPREQKLTILELLWRVVYADGVLEAREDALLHKMCTLLGLTHKELIALKLRVSRD